MTRKTSYCYIKHLNVLQMQDNNKQHRHDKLWMASVLSAFHVGLWEDFPVYHRKNKHRRVSDSKNKHIHIDVDVAIKFEIKSLILTYESEDRITDSTHCAAKCVSRLVTYRQ
jgi:hypothetical protein